MTNTGAYPEMSSWAQHYKAHYCPLYGMFFRTSWHLMPRSRYENICMNNQDKKKREREERKKKAQAMNIEATNRTCCSRTPLLNDSSFPISQNTMTRSSYGKSSPEGALDLRDMWALPFANSARYVILVAGHSVQASTGQLERSH